MNEPIKRIEKTLNVEIYPLKERERERERENALKHPGGMEVRV
jgi:hypothetical protein